MQSQGRIQFFSRGWGKCKRIFFWERGGYNFFFKSASKTCLIILLHFYASNYRFLGGGLTPLPLTENYTCCCLKIVPINETFLFRSHVVQNLICTVKSKGLNAVATLLIQTQNSPENPINIKSFFKRVKNQF